MHLPHQMLLAILPILSLATATFPPQPQYIFSNPTAPSPAYKIPTIHDSAILARRILNLSSIATLSTVFPSTPHHASIPREELLESRPAHLDLSAAPVGLMDYYAPCAPHPHNPTILAISIATTFKNARAGSNVSLSLRWIPPLSAPPSSDPYTYSAANMPRFDILGEIERIPEDEIRDEAVEECFLARHEDAKWWVPGNSIHESWWGRLRVRGVYWIGGFGDRAFIGWIPEGEWAGVTEEEIGGARLVGEEGYGEVAGEEMGEL